jgi:pSer/pThr/pTyr-binding forkhead associated (FHA) protein
MVRAGEEILNRDEPRGDETARFADDLISPQAPTLTQEEAVAIAALPSGSALLVVHRGPNLGARFLLDQDISVAGRHPDADIFLDDVTVSRKHAEFHRSGSQFSVRDLGSMNGIFVNGERVDKANLEAGTEVLIGKFRLTFYPSGTGL